MTSLDIPTIDVHAHVGLPQVDALLSDQPGMAEQRSIDAATLGPRSLSYNMTQLADLGPQLVDLDLRLAAMDAARVHIQAVAPLPAPAFWADHDLAMRVVAATNEGVRAYCQRAPERLLPVGSVALQHPDLAVEQLRSGIQDIGLLGVQIPTSAGPGRELDDPSLSEFWSAAEELGAAVLIHPWGCTLGERLNAYYLFNTVGNPTETALALSRIVFSGLLERHPALRIWSAHGGGYLGSCIVRAEHAWHAREDARTTQSPPSELLRRTYVDSLVYEPAQLRHLVAVMGPDRVTLGSDYPFDMGVEDPVDRLEAADFDTPTSEAIRGANAAQLLGVVSPTREVTP